MNTISIMLGIKSFKGPAYNRYCCYNCDRVIPWKMLREGKAEIVLTDPDDYDDHCIHKFDCENPIHWKRKKV